MSDRAGARPGLTLRGAVSKALLERGYQHVKVGVHLRPMTGEFKSVVDTGPLDGYGDIAPAAGLRHESVERLRSQLLELPSHGHTATVRGNVGEILGGPYRAWRDLTAVGEAIDSIDRAIDVMNQFASLERLPEAWRFRKASANDLYALVPIYLMLQDTEHVREALAEGEGAFCREEGVVCEQFRRFERNVEMRSARH